MDFLLKLLAWFVVHIHLPVSALQQTIKNGKFHGNGEWSRVNGDVYVGEFYDNDPHGSGVYEVSDGRTIEGTFTKGKLTAGILISQDGSATDVITGEPVDRSSLANRNATDVVTVSQKW